MLQVGLTHIHLIADGWQYHIRENTSLLGTVATGPVKLLHRDFQSAKVLRHSSRNRKDDPTDIPQLLNRPFSVGGGIANNKTALIILDCTGENLARTGSNLLVTTTSGPSQSFRQPRRPVALSRPPNS